MKQVGVRGWIETRMTISRWITSVVIIGFILATTTLGYLALSILSENKHRDFWAMIFMSMEIRGNEISRLIVDASGANNPELSSDPAIILRLGPKNNFRIVRGPGNGEWIDAVDLNLQSNVLRSRYSVLTYKGGTFVAKLAEKKAAIEILGSNEGEKSDFYFLWPMNVLRIFGAEVAADGPGVIYAVTTEGQLLVSTSRQISSANFATRRLVQRFISNDFRQGQLEFLDPDGKRMLGVFFQIPETNVVLFSETLKRRALAPVYQLRDKYAIMAVITLLLTIVTVTFSLRPVVDPITDMVRVARRISAGDFTAKPLIRGIGEAQILNMAFLQMASDLQTRDESIHRLHEEQKGKIRLEAELAVAKSIQDNFMPHEAISPDAHVQIETSYTPAAEAAGDWYCYYYDESIGESVVAIADVSGHGAGSAMFTAMIAGMFEYHREISAGKSYPVIDFIRGCNHLILTLGHKRWHATMQVATWSKGHEELKVYNAGHPPALLISPEDDGTISLISPHSHVVGMAEEFDIGQQSVTFKKGSSLFFYTDGLLEGARGDGTQFGQKRIARTCRSAALLPPKKFLEKILGDWMKHLDGALPDDDVCVMVMQRNT